MSFITLKEAQEMIATYQTLRPGLLDTQYSTDVLPLNITVPATEVAELIAQTDCEKVRIYLGAEYDQRDQPLITTILVGVNSNDEDIIPNEEYILINRGTRCPSVCPPASALTP